MKIRYFLLIIASTTLVWTCAPRQPLPPLLKPTEPPMVEIIDYGNVFLEAEALFAEQSFEDALIKYSSYIQHQPDGIHADAALKRMGDIHVLLGAYESARNTYKALLERHPQSPLVPDTMIAMLGTYDWEGNYEDLIRYSFEIPDSLPILPWTHRWTLFTFTAWCTINPPSR